MCNSNKIYIILGTVLVVAPHLATHVVPDRFHVTHAALDLRLGPSQYFAIHITMYLNLIFILL